METSSFLLVITVVSGVLNIILFFKIWGMTNDIDDIHKYSIPEEKPLDQLLGENCYEAAFRRVCVKVDVAYNTLTEDPEDVHAKKMLDEALKVLGFLGRELPPYLRSVEAYREYKLYANPTYRNAYEKSAKKQA